MPWGHINKPRLVLLVALLFTALGAGVFRTTSILFMAATLCGAPVIGWTLGRVFARGLRVSREMPTVGHVGQTIGVRLVIQNQSAIPTFLVTALSFLEEARFPWSDFAWGDKRGAELSSAVEIVGEPNFVTPYIPPRAEASGTVRWLLKRRGVYYVPGAGAGAFDPIGLYTHFPTRGQPGELIIVPRPLPLHRLEIGVGGKGMQRPQSRPTAASAADLHGVRPYQRGESVRRVHWKSTARTGELHVVEWEEETAQDLCVFLDLQAQTITGPEGEDTLESAIIAAASAMAYALENGQTVHLFWWKTEGADLKIEHHRAHHRAALSKILLALARVQPLSHPQAQLDELVALSRADAFLPDAALLLGTDRSPLAPAAARWGGVSKILCFDSAAFGELNNVKSAPHRSQTSPSPHRSSSSHDRIFAKNPQADSATSSFQKGSKNAGAKPDFVPPKASAQSSISGAFSGMDGVVLRPNDSIVAALEKRV